MDSKEMVLGPPKSPPATPKKELALVSDEEKAAITQVTKEIASANPDAENLPQASGDTTFIQTSQGTFPETKSAIFSAFEEQEKDLLETCAVSCQITTIKGKPLLCFQPKNHPMPGINVVIGHMQQHWSSVPESALAPLIKYFTRGHDLTKGSNHAMGLVQACTQAHIKNSARIAAGV